MYRIFGRCNSFNRVAQSVGSGYRFGIMKTLLLLSLLSFSFSTLAACPIFSEAAVSKNIEKILNSHNFELTSDRSAAYTFEQDKVELVTPVVQIAYGETRLYRRRNGYSTIFNIYKNDKFFHQSYGDAYNIFADLDYVPTSNLKNRSLKKALRDLDEHLPRCTK